MTSDRKPRRNGGESNKGPERSRNGKPRGGDNSSASRPSSSRRPVRGSSSRTNQSQGTGAGFSSDSASREDTGSRRHSGSPSRRPANGRPDNARSDNRRPDSGRTGGGERNRPYSPRPRRDRSQDAERSARGPRTSPPQAEARTSEREQSDIRVEAGESKTFPELGLNEHLCAAVAASGYSTPTPIQRQSIPHVLKGTDVLGCASTGTGKTAAFALPLLQQMMEGDSQTGSDGEPRRGRNFKHGIRSLILAPTRELAAQIHESFEKYAVETDLRSMVIFGGVGKSPQIKSLRRGVDICVATPGRLLDLHQEGYVDLRNVEHYVLDEADRMLDMGFIHDVRRITRMIPEERQTLLFSATMPKEIQQLANKILYKPKKVAVDPISSTSKPIKQGVYFVEKHQKVDLLIHLLEDQDMKSVLVFTRTKHGADQLCKKLVRADISAAAIHGNKSQNARERALAGIKSGDTRVVVATDIAARGIDVKGLSHVVNYELPNISESYVHRVGRTGRAGSTGVAIALCGPDERAFLRDIEKLTKKQLDRLTTPTFAGRAGSAGGREAAEAGRSSERYGRPAGTRAAAGQSNRSRGRGRPGAGSRPRSR